MEIQGYLGYQGRTDNVGGITHFIFITAFYTFMGYRNVLCVHGYEKCENRMPQVLRRGYSLRGIVSEHLLLPKGDSAHQDWASFLA